MIRNIELKEGCDLFFRYYQEFPKRTEEELEKKILDETVTAIN